MPLICPMESLNKCLGCLCSGPVSATGRLWEGTAGSAAGKLFVEEEKLTKCAAEPADLQSWSRGAELGTEREGNRKETSDNGWNTQREGWQK